MDFAELKELLAQFDESSLRVMDLSKADFHLFISKDKQEVQSATLAPAVNLNTATLQSESTTPVAEAKEVVVTTVESEPEAEGHMVTSPLVGVVYLSPAPSEPAFKSVGDTVKKGEVLCIVEAMKVMNEIVSDQDGTIAQLLVENEEVVEYGQPLFRII